ncbi:hypothetical protein DSM112329_03704 [Paraconexibacter sp. AEG42_29]|uniref:Endonuclease/exonuclease/phosphatase domain-containing protein n=1 Tax=Paraconexibacter sp. AEG42_29 TaxID=2997339 RepID=A0AAU7AZC3_9ACTN
MLSVLTWNVQGRVRTVPEQAAALSAWPADVVVLQEVRSTSAAAWTEALTALGHVDILLSLPAGRPGADPARRLGVLVAGAHPLRRLPAPDLPWAERYLAAEVATPDGPLVVHGLHVPTSARADAVKVRTLEAVRDHVAGDDGVPVVVCGDLNTPQYESREGEVRSFARTRTGRLREGFDERHDRAELGLVPGLADHGFVDAFRAVHGYDARDRSWIYPGRSHGYRLDHLFVRGARPVDARYVHALREDGLSDHSALLAVLELGRWRGRVRGPAGTVATTTLPSARR